MRQGRNKSCGCEWRAKLLVRTFRHGDHRERLYQVVSRLKATQCVDGRKEAAGIGLPFPVPTRYTNVRGYCVKWASGNKAEVRRCPSMIARRGRSAWAATHTIRGKNHFAGD